MTEGTYLGDIGPAQVEVAVVAKASDKPNKIKNSNEEFKRRVLLLYCKDCGQTLGVMRSLAMKLICLCGHVAFRYEDHKLRLHGPARIFRGLVPEIGKKMILKPLSRKSPLLVWVKEWKDV